MRKALICIAGIAIVAAGASTVMAGAIDNKTNWSAEYIRTLNRNAATDYADIAAYNPAGTVKMTEGVTLNGSLQFLGKDYKNIINGMEFTSDKGSIVPGAFAVYNKKKWSLFAAFSNYGGGGEVDFGEGNVTTVGAGTLLSAGADRQTDQGVQDAGGPAAPLGTYYAGALSNQSLYAKSYYLGFSFGGAYSINDIFSVSLAARYINAYREAEAQVTALPTAAGVGVGATPLPAMVGYEQDANGWGGIIGVNIAPNDAFNIGVRYETKTNLDFEATVLQDNLGILPNLGIIDGEENTRDLPATLGLGISYWFTEKLRVEADLTYYFNTNADWGGAEDNVDNGYDLGIAAEYVFTDQLLASFGYLRTETGIEAQYMLPENPELDANTIGGGIAYAFTEKFHTNLSAGYVFYDDDSFVSQTTGATIEYQKEIVFLAFGIEYRFM
jgi:long-chain fatty acid transport protein